MPNRLPVRPTPRHRQSAPGPTLLAHREQVNERLQKIIDEQTELWGIKVTIIEVKDVELPQTMTAGTARSSNHSWRIIMATTDDRLKNIGAELAGTLKLDTGIPIGDGHMGMEGAVEEPKNDIGQNDILAGERTAIVRDVARGTGEESERNSVAPSYAACEIDFRGHHQTNATRRLGSYEIYRVVYRYGFDLGADPRYRTAEWATVEQDARPRWEERNPNTWEEFKDTIRYAWDTARK